jgi:ADP-ribosylglycohydrolase/catechol 2,3-dioxygenase-like lactoylglutathione lyase family enzyme
MSNQNMDVEMEVRSVLNLDRVTSAYLGAAVGDALGWPFEGRARILPSKGEWKGEFFAWEKKSGGRFHPYLEKISAGEYSDDTQLILAVSRSLLKTEKWWIDFAQAELPFWTCYERGGGGATKRAATSWLTGLAPWQGVRDDSIHRYLNAGGNGVAMRILPHCVRGARSDDFRHTALDILTDGVITHGHPRALIGALAYGYALWYVLRLSETLNFGELVEQTIQNVKSWGELQPIDSRWADWRTNVDGYTDYSRAWSETINEMLELLHKVRDGINAGALARDDDVLHALGALNAKTNGAGTVTAAAAIYFASRYAASPLEGLTCSASAIGTDTDTVSSMTSAMLGALSGGSWLKKISSQLQDRLYIEHLAKKIASSSNVVVENASKPIRRTDLQKLIKMLVQREVSEPVTLPNDLLVTATSSIPFGFSIQSKELLSERWRLTTEDGLTLLVQGASPKTTNRVASVQPQEQIKKNAPKEIGEVFSIGISLNVRSLERSRVFYESTLGLAVSGVTAKTIRFGNNFALRRGELSLLPDRSITLFVNVSDVHVWHKKLMAVSGIEVSEIIDRGNTKSFECLDPDGYPVEIYERQSSGG